MIHKSESNDEKKVSKKSKDSVKKSKNSRSEKQSEYIDNFLKKDEIIMIKECLHFKDIILKEFKNNYDEIDANIKSLQIILGEVVFNRVVYFLPDKNHLDFVSLNENFDNLYGELKKMNIF